MTKPNGSRAVASMSLEEVYRKRAIDRENQRAFRSRQKRRIDELEGERNDLKQLLALANEQIERLKSTNAELLESIRSAQAVLGRFGPATAVTDPPSMADLVSLEQQSPGVLNQGIVCTDDRAQQEPTPPYSVSVQELTDKNTAVVDPSTGISFDLSQLDELDASLQFWDDVSFHSGGALGSNALSFAFPTPTMLDQIQDASMPTMLLDQPQLPVWERLPLHVEPTTKLDTSLMRIIESGRRHIATVGQLPELTEDPANGGTASSFPSVASLLNPGAPGNQKNAIAAAVGHDCKILVTARGLPERIAFMYNMCRLIRWLISPTKFNYESLPEFMRPVESQLTTPHPLWVDLLVWPRARERAIAEMDWSQFERFKTECAISNNWDREMSEILRASEDKTELSLSPEFERHVRDLRNWTVGKETAKLFPCFDCLPTEVQR